MIFVEETRRSETKNRKAVIAYSGKSYYENKPYSVYLTETGRVITRQYKERATTMTEARRIAREWCR